MTNVIELRPRDGGGDQPLRCPQCGGEWFALICDYADPGTPAQITLRTDYSISGYYGQIVCAACMTRQETK